MRQTGEFRHTFGIARLGVYQDGPFRVVRTADGLRVAPDPADAPFLTFVAAVAEHFDGTEVFGRVEGEAAADGRQLLPPHTGLVRLPAYGSLLNLPRLARAALGTARAFWHGMARVDLVWAFGPHPFELLLVAIALLRRKRVVLGVRQDTPAYFRARLPSRRWRAILAFVDLLDAMNRALARKVPATVVGEENAERYRRSGGEVAVFAPSLIRARDVVAEPPERDWTPGAEIGLLTVGRIDREKNPLLLVECLAALERAEPGRYRLRWVGTGPLVDEVADRAAALRVRDRIDLVGYVPFGPRLLSLYRDAHAFVHVSLTEGTPQVLVEALSAALPVVATDVGGVRRALGDGRAGELVPPGSLEALTAAIRRIAANPELRERFAHAGVELAAERTLEAEAARIAPFLAKTRTQT